MSGGPGRDPIAENPFYVLGLRPDAERASVEREGRKLLGLLTLGSSAAATYPTPKGDRERTESDVRWAMAELRDPSRRAVHAVWATLPPEPVPELEPATDGPWPDAAALLGR